MASTATLRYEGSQAELRGCYVTSWRYCACARCLALPVEAHGGHLQVTLDVNGSGVRLAHARRSSFVDVPADPRSQREICRDLAVALGVAV
jgi:hypothetical protein